MKKLVAGFVLFFAMGSIGNAQGIEFIHDKSFQQILDMARAQNRLVFVDCYTSWCGPCKRLASTVFPDSAVGDFYNQTFVNTKFDMEKDEGVTIANKYGIRAYPTLLWLDADGNEVHKIIGGVDAPTLIENGKKAIDPTPGILSTMRKQYVAGNRDVNFLADYVNTLYNAGEKYESTFNEYLQKLTPKDYTEAKHTKTIFNLTNDIKSQGLPYLMKNKPYYVNLVGADAFNKKINQIATKAVGEAPKANDKGMFDGAIDLVKKNNAADKTEKVLTLSMDYYSHMNDWVNYDKVASQYVKKYASKNAAALNDIAWNYFINVNNEGLLKKALKWSYSAVQMDNKYTNNITYAYLRYKLNDFSEAEKACDYAILRAKDENVEPKAATALKEAIEKSLKK